MKMYVCICACCAAYCCTAKTNESLSVGSLIHSMREDYGSRFPDDGSIREDWEQTCLSTNRHFSMLRRVVTNDWRSVLSNLACITNQTDRLIVIAAGTANTESDYLSRIDSIADMVLSNCVSNFELIYFGNRCSVANHHAESVFLRRYREASISNLIIKVKAAGGIPVDVGSIFSGEEKRLYDEAVDAGLIGP